MPRVLTSVLTPLHAAEGVDRDSLLERCRQRRRAAQAVGCNYWVFERREPSPAFVEFFEAGDDATLQRALDHTATRPDEHTILREVEL